jgi:phosphoserine phosphatase
MSTHSWQLDTPVSAVIFDCDGTLSAIEGIDELAKNNNVTDIVQRLTEEAMGKSGMNVNLYQERLNLVKPTEEQILQLGKKYIRHHVPDIVDVISLLQRLNKTVYIISAGLYPSVAIFGKFLNIPADNIYAVNLKFDGNGEYLNFDHNSPLVNRNGKRFFVNQIKQHHPTTAYVGDGLNDLEVKDLVTRFIGYGGIFYRKNIEAECQFYLKPASMAALLPYVLTLNEINGLTEDERKLYQHGLTTAML